MLVPGDTGRLGTPIYLFRVESLQPVWARYFMYAVAVETPRPEQGRHTPLLSYV
jgi:hypothetical protein